MTTPDHPFDSAALELVQDRLQAIFDATADAILVIDEESRILLASAAVEELLGHPPERLVGERMTALIPAELRDRHRAGLRRFVDTGERRIPWSGIRLPALHAEGRKVWVEVSFGSFEKDGRHYFAGVLRNVEARVAEEARRHAELEVARILAAGEPWEVALGRVMAAIARALGWQVGEFWRRAEDRLVLDAHYRADERFRPLHQTDHRFRCGTGLPGRVWEAGASVWSGELSEDEGFERGGLAARLGLRTGVGFPVILDDKLFGVVTLFTTEQTDGDPELREMVERIGTQLGLYGRRLEAERERDAMLEEARAARARAEEEAAARQRMLAVVSHDLRNMLQAFGFQLEVVNQLAQPEAQRQTAKLTRVLGDMTRLVEDLEAFAVLQSGAVQLQRGELDPAALVRSVRDLVRPLANGLELLTELDPELPRVEGDEARLRRVLLNLAHNAIKFTPAGGSIAFGARREEGAVSFWVRDTGIGIAPEHARSAFTPFWQDPDGKRGGSGLGLSIARGFVELHGGEIALDSEPGRGTTVRFRVPASG